MGGFVKTILCLALLPVMAPARTDDITGAKSIRIPGPNLETVDSCLPGEKISKVPPALEQ
jgi:hypothetical protein